MKAGRADFSESLAPLPVLNSFIFLFLPVHKDFPMYFALKVKYLRSLHGLSHCRISRLPSASPLDIIYSKSEQTVNYCY